MIISNTKVDTLHSEALDVTNTINNIESPNSGDSGTSTLEQNYQESYQKFGIELLDGDTIYLAAPTYETDYFDVPDYLTGQLDQLIPAMYLSKDLNFSIYCYSDENVEIFSKETIVYKRAEAIKTYLSEKGIAKNRLTVVGQSLDDTQKKPIFAKRDILVILVDLTNQ